MGLKKFLKDIIGITATEELLRVQLEEEKAEKARLTAEKKFNREEKKRKEKEAEILLTPKEIASKRKEPWVDVLHLHVNSDDIRNGFYELDWNEYWVLKLKQEGYGTDGDPDEEIVSRWFRDSSAFVAAEQGIDMTDRDVGYINIVKRGDGKSEVS